MTTDTAPSAPDSAPVDPAAPGAPAPAEKRKVLPPPKKAPKKKAGRPHGAKDSPASDRQIEARERKIRDENVKRERELLAKAGADPSLREWVNLPVEAGLPVYDLLHASIVGFAGLPGLSQEPKIREQWAAAFVGVANFYKLDLMGHPLVQLGVVSFVAATPSIAGWRVLKRIEAELTAGKTREGPTVKALLEEARGLGVVVGGVGRADA